jgi:cation transporter-like permease
MEQTPAAPRLDRRWAKPIALAVLVAVVSAALAYVVTLLPVGRTPEVRRAVAGVVMMCCSVAGFAWVVVIAFDVFDVDARSRQS